MPRKSVDKSVQPVINIMWFRRDLRLYDNAALYHALRGNHSVLPIFIFDKNILDQLDEKKDARVAFIHRALIELQQQLIQVESSINVYYGDPLEIFKELSETFRIEKVFTNNDYERYAVERDSKISTYFTDKNISFCTYKDHVIFEKNEVLKDDGRPYTVFTPYAKKWKAALSDFHLTSYPAKKYFANFYRHPPQSILSLESIGFEPFETKFTDNKIDKTVLGNYGDTRDFPAMQNGTSKMGIHLRFGTVSIRELAKQAQQLNEVYLNELIWRDFYQMITWHFPHIGTGKSFRQEYDTIKWRNNEKEFEAWCNGMTGYPMVDAGMRELNATGYMHNRVRMITASFLVKHLLIDWRWGEAYFALKLLDYDFAANNGGWQWAAGSGCDAAPYFRVFNPYLQAQKFDKNLAYIRKWVPELEDFKYPQPIVDHVVARKRVIEVFAEALKKK